MSISMKHLWLQAVVVTVFMVQAAGAQTGVPVSVPASSAPTPSQTVTLNFVNADIDGVVKAMAQVTGKNFVLDPRVKGTVNIISAQPVPRTAVYDVFL
ncbi:MAG: type II secretion system protein GspD, partial [Rhodanobacter sp.]